MNSHEICESCLKPELILDIQSQLLRFGIWTSKIYRKKNTVHLRRYDWMSRVSCKFRGKIFPILISTLRRNHPANVEMSATPKFWKIAGYLKHGILHFRGATILLEIHLFFPEPNEYGRKGVNISPTRTWKRKSRAQ